ncbi:hypothetical protein K2Z84_02270 [Candidatus Binatia bacterium]|nr:hypothetical protein [Candidatus Binatia bacterium]
MALLNSGIVDVGVALIYVFVLVSILVSAVNEIFAGLLKQRSKALHQGIGELLQSSQLRNALYAHPLIKTLAPPTSKLSNLFRSAATADAIIYPLTAKSGPSYIPKDAFSAALVDLLGGTPVAALVREVDEIIKSVKDGAKASPELAAELTSVAAAAANAGVAKDVVDGLNAIAHALATGPVDDLRSRLEPIGRALGLELTRVMIATARNRNPGASAALADVVQLVAAEAPASVEQVRKAIEAWFDAGMDRVAGWYKRWTQLWQLCIGLVIAVALNINVATIGVALWNDIPLRNAIVADAEKFAQNPPQDLVVREPVRNASNAFDLSVTPPLFSAKDNVQVGIELRAAEQQDVTVTINGKNIVPTPDKVVIKAGNTSASVEGKVDRLPTDIELDASYTVNGQKREASLRWTVPLTPGVRIARARELLGPTLPIGWPTASLAEWWSFFKWWMVPGWLLTAIGASFGAPFWFDLLNRVVQLRSGGRKPDGGTKTESGAEPGGKTPPK